MIPVLVLLRWPPDTDRASAPACPCLARLWDDWRVREIPLLAWLARGSAGTDTAETAGGSMAIMLLEFNGGLDAKDIEELEAFFGRRTHLCRYETVQGRSSATACSSATLVYVEAPLALNGNDLGALEDARAVGILKGLQEGAKALRDVYTGDAHKSVKRRLNFVLKNVGMAIHAAEGGAAGSGLNRAIGTVRTMASMQAAFGSGGEGDISNIESFAEFLQSRETLTQAPFLRPGFGDPMMCTTTALSTLVRHVDLRALEELREGPVTYPRLGRVRPRGASGKGPSRILFNLDSSQKPAIYGRGNAKHACVWIAQCSTVDLWLKHQGRGHMRDFPLLDLGTLRLVTSVALHEKAYSVEESVLTLPCWNRGVSSEREADPDEPPLALEERELSTDRTTPVYTFELRKMHEELFLHESLKDIIHTLEKMGQERQGSAGSMWVDVGSPVAREKRVSELLLRSLLGLSVSGAVVTSEWISTLLGKPQSQERAELCEWLQTRMGLSLTYTQRCFFLDWEHSLAALHCVPGAGKTLFLELLAVTLVERSTAHPVRLLITEPNVTMCAEVYKRLCKTLGSAEHVARIGFDNDRGVDLWKEWLEHVTKAALQVERGVLGHIDSLIGKLTRELQGFPVEGRMEHPGACRRKNIICAVLAKRHEYLDNHVYKAKEQAQLAAVAKAKCFVFSSTNLAKFESLEEIMRQYFREGDDPVWWLARDEYTQEQLPMTVAGARMFVDALLLIGDPWQGPHSSLVCRNAGPTDVHMQALHLPSTGERATGKSLNTSAWVEKTDDIKVYQVDETSRLGPTMVRIIHRVLPASVRMQSARGANEDTLFLPVLFKGVMDWVYAGHGPESEVARSHFIFSHVCSIIALEVVLAVMRRGEADGRAGVVVIGFLNQPLDNLEVLLYQTLQALCVGLHASAGLALPARGEAAYDYISLRNTKVLQLVTVIPAGGLDRHAAILLGFHRQKKDWGPEGLMCQSHALLIGLSRASLRCHVLTEDMRQFIYTPERGDVKLEGSEYGLRDVGSLRNDETPAKCQVIANGSRKHMAWVRLWAAAEQEWSDKLQVQGGGTARVLMPGDWHPAPTFASRTLWDTLLSSEAYLDCGPLLRKLAVGPDLAMELLTRAWEGFESMKWDAPRPQPLALPRKTRLPTYEEVFRSDTYLKEQKRNDPNLYAPAPAKAHLPVDVCELYGSERVEEEGTGGYPNQDWLLRFWRLVVLPTVTVHVASATEVKVCVCVASVLHTPAVAYWELPGHTGPGSERNVCHLLQFLANEMWNTYGASAEGDAIRAAGGELRREVIRHKKPLVDLETGEVRRAAAAPREGSIVQGTANADRPGFVIEVKRSSEDKWKEVLEFYPAMGLDEQHGYQEAMLSRCHSHGMATCIVDVMKRWLLVQCTHATISFTGSRKQFPEEAARDLVRTFTEQLEQVVGGLPERSAGVSIEELAGELPREGHLSEIAMGAFIGALVGDDVGN